MSGRKKNRLSPVEHAGSLDSRIRRWIQDPHKILSPWIRDLDFALAFYIVHEVPEKDLFFGGIYSALKPGGRVHIVEPPFHVSRREFQQTPEAAGRAGFRDKPGPKMFFGKTALLERG